MAEVQASLSFAQPMIVYFSSLSRNTERFVDRLDLPTRRISMSSKDPVLVMDQPYVLVCPTYAGDHGEGAVPKQVIRFLNHAENRKYIQGVVASGNRNFGKYYAYAGAVISHKCQVPWLYKFELMGTPEDVNNVRNGVDNLWRNLPCNPQTSPQIA